MSWVGMPVDIVERLERLGLSRDDRLLYVEGFLYAGQYLTDGIVTARLARLSDHPEPDEAAARLVEADVWHEAAEGGYVIADYFSANLRRDEIARRKEDARVRQERSRRHRAGDHSMCIRGRYCPDGQADTVTRDVTRDETRESRPTYLPDLPDLPGKVREGKGSRDGRGSPKGSPAPSSAPHVFADPQRLGHCHHCNLPASNAAHHLGAPQVLSHLGELTVELGRLIPERIVDTESHYWRARIDTESVAWAWETEETAVSDDPRCVNYMDAAVRVRLTDDDWGAWHASYEAAVAASGRRAGWLAERDEATVDVYVSGSEDPSSSRDVTGEIARMSHLVAQLLAGQSKGATT